MKNFLKTAIPALILLILPVVAGAQAFGKGELGWFGNVFTEVLSLINTILIPLVFALLILAFFWGVFTYFILGGGDEGKRESGRQLMLYAIIGFVVVAALYGIIAIVQSAFGIDADVKLDIPTGPDVRP